MDMPRVQLREIVADLKTAIAFLTRLPISGSKPMDGAKMARALWTAPLVGVLVGSLAAASYWLAYGAGLPPFPAAALALAATLAATGCLHEDGLADLADGFAGGATRERKLEIMRDSRIGTYGTCAVTLSLLLRAGALASLADPALVAPALIGAHAAARAPLPAFMRFLPAARADGLSSGAGRPPRESVIAAALLGTILLALALGPARGAAAFVLVVLGFCFLAWLCTRQIGGQTGDVLGALQQLGEILVLLVATA